MSSSFHKWNNNHAVPLLVLVAITFAVFGQVLGHEFITNWDDRMYVVDNPAIKGFSLANVRTIFTTYYVGNYAPVQMLSYMLDYALWGGWAGGFLLTNLVIHVINGLLFYRLLLRFHGERLIAFIGSALFLIHPVQVESVAWVSQRKNVLAMLFFLLAWEYYCRYREAEPGRGRINYLVSVATFFLALLAKSVAVIFPVVIVLFDLCFPAGAVRLRLKDKLPFVLAAAAAAWLALISQEGGGRSGFHGGGPLATFYTMLPVLCRYLGMLFWPVGLSAEYDPQIYQTITPTVAGAMLLLAVIAGACGLLLARNSKVGFWALLFFVGLLPVSQIVPLVTLINDRYLYVPMLGAAALFAVGSDRLLKRSGTRCSGTVRFLLAGMLLVLTSVSWQRVSVWRDDFALWSDAVAKYPGKATIQSAMGDVLLSRDRVDDAWQRYELALKLNPLETTALLNLGILYSQKGNLETGQRMLKEVILLDPRNFKGWANLGNNLALQGDYSEAEDAYLRAYGLQPDELKLLVLLGNAALLQRDPVKARKYYLQAEARGGDDPEVACGLARTEALAGSPDNALRWLETALQRGFDDLDQLQEFSELAGVRRSAEFTDLVRRHDLGKGQIR